MPAEPSSPVVLLNLLLGFLIASLAAIGWAVARELKEPRLRRAEDVVATLGLPVLVSLGNSRRARPVGALGLSHGSGLG